MDLARNTTLLPEQLSKVQELESHYEKLFKQYPTSYETIDAYMQLYGAAEVLFQRNFSSDDNDLQQFRSVINKGDHLVLRENWHKVYVPYMSMIDRLQELFKQPNNTRVEDTTMDKKPKVFISHSSEDKKLVKEIVGLFEFIGVKGKENLLCSSVDGYRIPLGTDFADCLREQFAKYNLFVVFVHTNSYYLSPICLNEMGAAWAVRSEYYSILSPDFDYYDMKGVVNNREIALKLGTEDCSSRLNELKNNLVRFFGLPQPDQERWEDLKKDFIDKISGRKLNEVKLIEKGDGKTNNSITTETDYLYSLSSQFRLHRVEEGLYQFQLDIKFAALEDVYFKDVFLCNENGFVEMDMANAEGNALHLIRGIKSNVLDIQTIKSELFDETIDNVYKKMSFYIEDHRIQKNALETMSFHSPIYLKRESDGYDDLPETEWYVRVTYNISGVLEIPLNPNMI